METVAAWVAFSRLEIDGLAQRMIFLACAAAGADHKGGPSSPAPPAHGDGSPDLGASASLEPDAKRARHDAGEL